MEISKEMRGAVKPACWGAAGGAIALAIIGFTWGGWVTGGHAKTLADAAVTGALVQKVGDRTISTSDRSFAKACGLEVMKRDKEAVAKSASK
jgi:hypothetical protein